MTFTCTDAFVQFSYGDGSTINFIEHATTTTATPLTYGVAVPTNLTTNQFVASSTSKAYLVLNAEFEADATLNALEFYMAKAGNIAMSVTVYCKLI